MCACQSLSMNFNSSFSLQLWLAYEEKKGEQLKLTVFCQTKGKYELYARKTVAEKFNVWGHRGLNKVCPEHWKFICQESSIKKSTVNIHYYDRQL